MLEVVIFCHQTALTKELQDYLTSRNLVYKEKKFLTIKTELEKMQEIREELSRFKNLQIKISTLPEILFNQKQLKQRVKMEIERVMASSGSEIYLIQNELEIIKGFVHVTRLECLSLLDRLFGLRVKTIIIPQNLHAIVNGRKRVDLNEIMYKTRTSFYFPICFGLKNRNPANNGNNNEDLVYVTGLEEDINVAIEMYMELVNSVEGKIISKQISCQHRKLDWLYTFKKDNIRKIMADNAVHVEFPLTPGKECIILGGHLMTVSGLKTNLVDRAIRSIKQLICDCYLASIQTANILDSPEAFTRFAADIAPSLQNTSASSGAEIILGKNIIDIYGTHSQTKQAYKELTSLESIKIRDTKFQIELSLEHKDFINGKKNGKINRITKTSGCRIAFQEHNDVNMMIDIYSAIPSCLLAGLEMLEEELPAEMSFHIPETFHKRIIGVGGKNIQKIMKRFGVYVKFSNTEEYEALGGYYENADNVICRTPSKNQENLKDLKASIVEAVNATDLIETKDTITLPRQLYQWVCGENGENIGKIQQEFRVRVNMPDKESGSDEITLEGPESAMEGVKERLRSFVPQLSDFQVPGTEATQKLLDSEEFKALEERLKQEYEITTRIATFPIASDTDSDFTFFLIYPSTLSTEKFDEAKKLIEDLFLQQNVPFSHVAKNESYSNLNTQPQVPYDSFLHFNSKLLAPVNAAQEGNNFGNIFSDQGKNSIRSLFDEAPGSNPPPPPGLQRSGSDLRPKANSVIARPGPSNLRRPLAEKTEYLRHTSSLTRPALTMPDLSSMSVGKSASMTDIMQSSIDTTTARTNFPWTGSTFSKSLSSSAIVQEKRPNSFSGGEDYSMVSPTDIEFDQKMEYQVQALDKHNSDESDRISRVLESIDHSKYLPLFVEHEIDYQTFLALEDGDLKELGIKALGSRKKILSVIKECREKDKVKSSPEQRMGKGFDF